MYAQTMDSRSQSLTGSAVRTCRRRLGLLAPLLLWGTGLVSAQESASYKIKSLSVTNVADEATSSSYVNAATAVTVSGASGVCPSGTAVTFGFWSLLGTGEVPVFLTVDKGATNLTEVHLGWSGQSSEFTVYRSPSPTDVISPDHVLATTNLCEETDSTAGVSDVVFYKVAPVAP